jgi:uncharacterized protein YukE
VSDGFPEAPKGSPGGIRSAARSIGQVGDALEDVGQGVVAASGAIEADWQGWAASSYLACAHGLIPPIRSGVEAFRSCEKAISSYAGLLEHTQDELQRLHGLWVEAKQREAAANASAAMLAGQLAAAKPDEMAAIGDRLTIASNDAGDAADEATRLVNRANEVLGDFEQEARSYAGALENPDSIFGLGGPFTGGPLAGSPGFGIPAGGLGSYGGQIHVEHPNQTVAMGPGELLITPSAWAIANGGTADTDKVEPDERESTNIPGFGGYWAARHGRNVDAVEDDDSLINPVNLLAGGLSGLAGRQLLGQAARLATGAARGTSLIGRDEAVAVARREAEALASAVLSAPTRNRAAAIAAAGENAAIKRSLEWDAAQASSVKNALDVAGKAGAPLPGGTEQVAAHLLENRTAYHFYTYAQLLRAEAWLQAHPSPLTASALSVVEKALEKVG